MFALNSFRYLLGIAAITFLLFFGKPAYAQVKLSIDDIQKINLIDASGGLGGGRLTKFEIIRQNDKWKCYQTLQSYSELLWWQKDSATLKSLNSKDRHFIKDVNPQAINDLLQSVSIIKPVFKPEYLNVTADIVIKKLDSAKLVRYTGKKHDEFMALLRNKGRFNAILDSLQHDGWTDDGPYCGIEIIKNNNDTIKVETYRQVDFMLPWQINKVNSYDVNIGRFFSNTIGDYPYSARGRLTGDYLPQNIYSNVDYFYAEDLFERERLQQLAPQNLTLLKHHFNIIKAAHYNENFLLTLTSKSLPASVTISGIVDIKNKVQLLGLIKYTEDTIKRVVNSNNFVIAACRNTKGCVLNFYNNFGRPNIYLINDLYSKYDYLDKYKKDKTIDFGIGMAGSRDNRLLLLPDNSILLTDYFDDFIPGVSPGILPITGNHHLKKGFIHFSGDGKIVFKSVDFASY